MITFDLLRSNALDVDGIEVRPVRADDRPAWDEFVAKSPDTTFFHRWEWRALLCGTLDYEDRYMVACEGGQIVGILPLVEVGSRLFGRSLTSLPFCSYAGPVASGERGDEIVRLLIAAASELGREGGVSHVEIRSLHLCAPSAPSQDLYSTFRAAIPADLDSMKGIPQKRRNVVRRACAIGLRDVVDRDANRFFELYAENARAHGTPALGRAFFVALIEAFPTECDVLYVVDASGVDVSAILSFYHRTEVLAYFAGEVSAARETNANDFKYWSLMKHARSRGCDLFDFGRSKAGTGSFRFKQLWGFEPHLLHYQFPFLPSGRVPQTNPTNPKYRLAIETWKRMPRAFVDRVGPLIVGGLG
jgi:FemAB-related protein (PEP-CTERM system-associated)